jgi:PadR family transcriptional regulator AphA
MSRQKRTHFVLLGLLATRPRSAYDLSQFIQQSMAHFWSESEGQIYPSLKEMAQMEWIESEEKTDPKRPKRIIYKILPLGREKLMEWFLDDLQEDKPRSELLLKLFCSRNQNHNIALEILKKAQTQVTNKTMIYDEAKQRILESKAEAHFWGFTLKYMMALNEAEQIWLSETQSWIEQNGRFGENK